MRRPSRLRPGLLALPVLALLGGAALAAPPCPAERIAVRDGCATPAEAESKLTSRSHRRSTTLWPQPDSALRCHAGSGTPSMRMTRLWWMRRSARALPPACTS